MRITVIGAIVKKVTRMRLLQGLIRSGKDSKREIILGMQYVQPGREATDTRYGVPELDKHDVGDKYILPTSAPWFTPFCTDRIEYRNLEFGEGNQDMVADDSLVQQSRRSTSNPSAHAPSNGYHVPVRLERVLENRLCKRCMNAFGHLLERERPISSRSAGTIYSTKKEFPSPLVAERGSGYVEA